MGLALFPQFVDPARGSTCWQILALASVPNVIGFAVNGAVVLAAGRFAEFLGTVFGRLALRLAIDTDR